MKNVILFIGFIMSVIFMSGCDYPVCGNGICEIGEYEVCEEDCVGHEEDMTCTDSDGGKEYFVLGETKGMTPAGYYSVMVDHCVSSNVLEEYYCHNGLMYDYRETCPYGCIDGACINKNRPCVEEGDSLGVVYPGGNTAECCPGLTQISASYGSISASHGSPQLCTESQGMAGYCTRCGDGNCIEPENPCNCKQDCKQRPVIIDLQFSQDGKKDSWTNGDGKSVTLHLIVENTEGDARCYWCGEEIDCNNDYVVFAEESNYYDETTCLAKIVQNEEIVAQMAGTYTCSCSAEGAVNCVFTGLKEVTETIPDYEGTGDLKECLPVCVPDCVGKTCGLDGCGGYCGQCIAHNRQTITKNGVTYTWSSSLPTTVRSTGINCDGSGVCPALFCYGDTCLAYRCINSNCALDSVDDSPTPTCTVRDTQYSQGCYDGDVYWFDNCGGHQSMYQDCKAYTAPKSTAGDGFCEPYRDATPPYYIRHVVDRTYTGLCTTSGTLVYCGFNEGLEYSDTVICNGGHVLITPAGCTCSDG